MSPRIISGKWRGRYVPSPVSDGTRPTSDRVREALFTRLEHLGRLSGARVLDLYAGTGALGLEALSRGAASAEFVEQHRQSAAALRDTAAGFGAAATVHTIDVGAFLRQGTSRPFDLVFADPPYGQPTDQLDDILATLERHTWLGDDALIVVERSIRTTPATWPARWEDVQSKTYGETALWFAYTPDDEDDAPEGEDGTDEAPSPSE